MLVSDFDYLLPPELIAQHPLADRSATRMMHVRRYGGPEIDNLQFRSFPDLLSPDDLVVFNNTRVLPARLFGRRSGSRAQTLSPQNPASREFLTGRVEVLLTRQIQADPPVWQALVRPGRKLGVGEKIFFGEDAEHPELTAEILERGEFGERTLRFTGDFWGTVNRIGHIPLPPYIDRPDTAEDREQYQTIFARELGSVAAPTAGLHFTREILDRIAARGIETAELTLHVGLGTFQPLRHENVEENHLHLERYSISADAAEKLNRARREGRRIVAVGTTIVRTLEFAAQQSKEFGEQSGDANIFIYPGYEFRVVGGMLTNFHLPKSSLLMLVSAFAGTSRALRAYNHAVAERYRFFSYGDCMFIE
ncbi:tRNA preQ1(34) S-adenosylmethionine ribosyltransferase-isomerase QueA [Candidatus Korobacter versatilis]|uniref:tRNA preQ1(34) S-adenosylmethionine ribosyltransferase-isomerase QueA n=1 Tax=Candidatus Korobacter versatilis TaxID=658062 RepID=UPI0002F801FB|nr:tRNA preQ1(34) S-adenosylmethionine ribosyltransferase-isomerase QueA [Candidatus Koribacter versatilis]